MNLDQLKEMDPKMYEVINSYYSNKDNRNFRSSWRWNDKQIT